MQQTFKVGDEVRLSAEAAPIYNDYSEQILKITEVNLDGYLGFATYEVRTLDGWEMGVSVSDFELESA